jgi:hypothetical protein
LSLDGNFLNDVQAYLSNISTMLVLTGPLICEKKIKCKKLQAMTDNNASANNDDAGRQSHHLWVR